MPRKPFPCRRYEAPIVTSIVTAAIHLKNQYHAGAVPVAAVRAARDVFDERLLDLAARPRAVPAYQRLADHLLRHRAQCG